MRNIYDLTIKELEEYTKTIVENDTDKIRADLEAGKELPFAHLEPRGESLRIK